MKTYRIATTVVGLLAVGGLSLAGTAGAMPVERGSAADVVAQLQADGHHVQVHGTASG